MLTFKVGQNEMWNSETEEFEYQDGITLSFEYTLRIIAAWEAKWKKAWLSSNVPKEQEEILDMYKMMCTEPDKFSPIYLTKAVQESLINYINDTQTATTFSNIDKTAGRKVITSEVIYASMCAGQVPFECQDWHLGRLLTLIQVIGESNSPKKKMSPRDEAVQRDAINRMRREELKSKG